MILFGKRKVHNIRTSNALYFRYYFVQNFNYQVVSNFSFSKKNPQSSNK